VFGGYNFSTTSRTAFGSGFGGFGRSSPLRW